MFFNPHFKYFHSFEYEITNIFFLDILSSATTAITQNRVCNTCTILKFLFLWFIFSITFF